MRGITQNDFLSIYKMYQNRSLLHLWAPGAEFDSFEDFVALLNRRLMYRWDHGFVFEEAKNNRIAGFAYCYNASEMNRNACVCIYMDQSYIGHVYALKSSYLYLNHLFGDIGYNKIYAEVYAYNTRCVRLLRHIGFMEEACLKDHQIWNNRYWGQYIFSISKQLFESKKKFYQDLIERVFNK